MHEPEAVLTHGLTSGRPKLYVDTFKSEPTGHWGTAPRWALGKYGTTGGHRTGGNGDPNNQPGFFALVPATF